MAQSWLCSLCNHSSALTFCTCEPFDTLLCAPCCSVHLAKHPTRDHQQLPLIALGPHRIPGYFERLQVRLEALQAGKGHLEQSNTRVDACIAEVQEQFRRVIDSLMRHHEATLNRLYRAKADMQAWLLEGVTEAERTLYEETPLVGSEFAKCLRNREVWRWYAGFQYQVLVASGAVGSLIDVEFSWRPKNVHTVMSQASLVCAATKSVHAPEARLDSNRAGSSMQPIHVDSCIKQEGGMFPAPKTCPLPGGGYQAIPTHSYDAQPMRPSLPHTQDQPAPPDNSEVRRIRINIRMCDDGWVCNSCFGVNSMLINKCVGCERLNTIAEKLKAFVKGA